MSKHNFNKNIVLLKNNYNSSYQNKETPGRLKCIGKIISRKKSHKNKKFKDYNIEILSEGCNKGKKIVNESDLIRVFECDRSNYHPNNINDGTPQIIIDGQTISAKSAHEIAINLLSDNLTSGKNILDIGCGSGILICEFAKKVLPNSNSNVVVGIDIRKDLVDYSIDKILNDEKLKKWYYNGRIIILQSNAYKFPTDINNKFNRNLVIKNNLIKFVKNIKFDAIHIGAGLNRIPKNLFNCLKNENSYICGPSGSDKRTRLTWKCCSNKTKKCKIKSGPFWYYVELIEKLKKGGAYKKSKKLKSIYYLPKLLSNAKIKKINNQLIILNKNRRLYVKKLHKLWCKLLKNWKIYRLFLNPKGNLSKKKLLSASIKFLKENEFFIPSQFIEDKYILIFGVQNNVKLNEIFSKFKYYKHINIKFTKDFYWPPFYYSCNK